MAYEDNDGEGIYYVITIYRMGRSVERLVNQDILACAKYVEHVLSRGRSSGCKVRAYAYDLRDYQADVLLHEFKNSYLRTLCRS